MTKNIPTVFVIFGATGDLMARKIAPALFHLFHSGQLPNMFTIIGFGRRPYSDDDFRAHVSEALMKHYEGAAHTGRVSDFLGMLHYHQGTFEEGASYKKLAKRLGQIDGEWRVCSNKLFYLATPPESNELILRHIDRAHLAHPCSPEEGWTRILVEKPFGKNIADAKNLDILLGKLFKEEQVYRIDHYLAKEILQNIMMFRFSNNLLEEVWNNQFIEKIDIRLLEKIDIEGRGNFFDGVGALLDVGQNHLLQMLALIAMENPGNFSSNLIREKRGDILEKIAPPTDDAIAHHTFRGQYHGYLKEKGVRKTSQTETYFKLQTEIDSPRWHGVPITLEAGKKMPRVNKEIVVTFRHPSPCLCPRGGKHYKNRIYFRIEPDPGIAIRFWSKKPGQKLALEEQVLSFEYQDGEHKRYLEEYAKLISDVIAGDQTLFVSSAETMAGWRFIDPIVTAWHKKVAPLVPYTQSDVIFKKSKVIETPALLKKAFGQIGVIGLGKMGGNLARRMSERGWQTVGWNRTADVTKKFVGLPNFFPTYTLKELARATKSKSPRTIILMLPHATLDEFLFGDKKVIASGAKQSREEKGGLVTLLTKGDLVIDAGNSYFKDSIRRGSELEKRGIHFLDMGTSGGPGGARRGPCLMIGGREEDFKKIEPLVRDIGIAGGVAFFAGHGAGHFVKMVHNGIEYGMMQALAEGFALMKKSNYKLDLEKVASLYNHGSVIESRLVGWLEDAFKMHGQNLKGVSGTVAHTGEGSWTVKTAQEAKVPAPIIEGSLKYRVRTEKNPDYIGQLLAALREQFGGHGVK